MVARVLAKSFVAIAWPRLRRPRKLAPAVSAQVDPAAAAAPAPIGATPQLWVRQLQTLDAHAIVSAADAAGMITYVNDRFCEVSGYAREELLGKNHRILKSGQHDASFYEQMWSQIASGRPWHGELCNRRKDGSPYWVEATIVPFLDGQGMAQEYVSVRTEVTALKEAERRARAAEEQAAVFRRLVDATEQGIGLTDAEGRFQYINEAGARILGRPRSGLLGRHWRDIVAGHARPMLRAIVEAARAGTTWCGLVPVERGDGSEIVLKNSVGVIGDAAQDGGARHHVFNIFSDHSDDVAREAELRRACEAAESANRMKSDFLARMSHELRTPLNGVIGYARMLERQENLKPEQLAKVRGIAGAGRHLLELVDELLDLARIEAGDVALCIEEVFGAAVALECVSVVEPLAQSKNVAIERQIDESLCLAADRVRLKQALINLLSNAVKYNRLGGRVSLRLLATATGRARIEVQDTGNGIAAEQLHKLFRPFSRLENRADIEGTGIGLAITQQLVALMDGAVGVASEVGIGSTFWIELPLRRSARSAIAGLPPARRELDLD